VSMFTVIDKQQILFLNMFTSHACRFNSNPWGCAGVQFPPVASRGRCCASPQGRSHNTIFYRKLSQINSKMSLLAWL